MPTKVLENVEHEVKLCLVARLLHHFEQLDELGQIALRGV